MGSSTGARAVTLLVTALLAACTTPPGGPGDKSAAPAAEQPHVVVPPGIALPAGYHIDSNRSLILGDGEGWTGRLSYSASGAADDVFEFLRREMPQFGWTETYAVRAEVDLLGFAAESTGRVANIRIERGSMLDNTHVDLIVSPATAPARPASGRTKPSPAR
jgi:hypothetical protein